MLKYDLIRVDDRLIHGQILLKWMKVLKVKRAAVLSDELNMDPIMKAILAKTVPEKIQLDIWGVRTGIERMYEESGKALILLQDIHSLFQLFQNGIQLKRVSISRLPCEAGKEKIHEQMFVSKEERKELGVLLNHGVDIQIQMVPDSESIRLRDIL